MRRFARDELRAELLSAEARQRCGNVAPHREKPVRLILQIEYPRGTIQIEYPRGTILQKGTRP